MRLEDKTMRGSKEKMWVVFEGQCPIGFITKYRNTKHESHPYKACYYTKRPIKGQLAAFDMIGAFYEKDGRKRAMAAIAAKFED